jgi:4'-phosphopantetheinyl transferase EntD
VALAAAEIVPPWCAFAIESVDAQSDGIFAEERMLSAGAVLSRQREFAAGRRAARSALARLGFGPAPLLKDAAGAPRWPAQAVGSISHSAAIAVAVAALRTSVSSIGLDVETSSALRPEARRDILSAEEEMQLARVLGTCDGGALLAAAYSLKEAYFKFQYPLTRRWLEFRDAGLRAGINSASLGVRIESSAGVPVAWGRAISRRGLTFALVLPWELRERGA